MATYEIPKTAGTTFWTITSAAGTPIVTNGRTGKDEVFIPCKDMNKARRILQQLDRGDHHGIIKA